MPSYDYHCPVCAKDINIIKSIHDNTEEQCDNCKVPLVKKMYAPPVSFKGGGWAHKE